MNKAKLKLGPLMVFNHTWEQLGKARKANNLNLNFKDNEAEF